MSLPPFIHQHGIQSIHYLYELYGYEQLMKEIHVIHHIRQSTYSTLPPVPENEVVPNDALDMNQDPPSNEPSHYKRVNVISEHLCSTLLKNGKQCSSSRKKGFTTCSRHIETK